MRLWVSHGLSWMHAALGNSQLYLPCASEFRNPPGGLGFPGLLWCKKKPLSSGLSPNSCLFLRMHLPTKAGDHLRLTNHCPLLPLAFNSSVSPDQFPACRRDSSSAVSLLEWHVPLQGAACWSGYETNKQKHQMTKAGKHIRMYFLK